MDNFYVFITICFLFLLTIFGGGHLFFWIFNISRVLDTLGVLLMYDGFVSMSSIEFLLFIKR